MKKVLISVDESKGSKATLSVFSNMVKPPEEVILLHVERPGGKSLMYEMLGEAEMKTLVESMEGTEAKEALDRKAEQILAYYKKELANGGLVNIRTMVRLGNPSAEIVKVAEEEGVELVILGCNGKTALQKLVSGCVTKSVEKNLGVPVLVAKADGCDTSCGEHITQEGKLAYAK